MTSVTASIVSSAPPPEAESIVSLTKVAGILVLIFGIIAIFFGAVFIIVLIGILPLIAGVLNILIYMNCTEIIRLVERGEYRRAKEKTLAWMIIDSYLEV